MPTMTGLSIKNKSKYSVVVRSTVLKCGRLNHLQNIIKSITVECLVTEKYWSVRPVQKSVYTSTGLSIRN